MSTDLDIYDCFGIKLSKGDIVCSSYSGWGSSYGPRILALREHQGYRTSNGYLRIRVTSIHAIYFSPDIASKHLNLRDQKIFSNSSIDANGFVYLTSDFNKYPPQEALIAFITAHLNKALPNFRNYKI